MALLRLRGLPKHQLEAIRSGCSRELKERYQRPHEPRYGNLRRELGPEHLAAFWNAIDHPKVLLLAKLSYKLALSRLEAVSLRTNDFRPGERRLLVRSRKGRNNQDFPLDDELYGMMTAWMTYGSPGDEWMFPPVKESNQYPHLSPNWYGHKVREALDRAGLGFSYGNSKHQGKRGVPRKLRIWTAHSLRHTGICRVGQATGDYFITKQYSRLRSDTHLQTYMRPSKATVDAAIINAFR